MSFSKRADSSVVAIACESKNYGRPISIGLRELADEVAWHCDEHLTAHVGRLLAEADVCYRTSRNTWLSPDPQFD